MQQAKIRQREPTVAPTAIGNAATLPRGPTALHKLQRTNTRKRILEAAEAVLSERRYIQATVEEIAARAKVTKITFYRYYSSKFDVANAVSLERLPELLAIFDSLAETNPRDAGGLQQWLSKLLGHFERYRSFLGFTQEMSALEPQSRAYFLEFYSIVSEKLQRQFPQFLVAEATAYGRARAYLLMSQILNSCFSLALYDDVIDRDSALAALARQVQHFLEEMEAATGPA